MTTRTFSVAVSGSVPGWASGLSALQVRNMTGAYTPTNGKETFLSVTPTAWQGVYTTGAKPQHVFNAWSGGKGDATGSRLIVHGGGHADSANNGVYIYTFGPGSRPIGWTVVGQSASIPASGSDVAYGDGRPTSVHSYDQQWYLNGRLYRFSGSAYDSGNPTTRGWYCDLTSGAWTQFCTGLSVANGGFVASDGSKFLYMPGGAGLSTSQFIRSDGTVIASSTTAIASQQTLPTAAYDSVNDRWLTVGTEGIRTYSINWTAETWSSTFRTTNLTGEGGSLVFDSAHSGGPCFWAFGFKADEQQTPMTPTLRRIDASTFAVTSYTLTGDSVAISGSSSNVSNGSYNRHVWFPLYRVIATVQAYDAPVSIIKVPD